MKNRFVFLCAAIRIALLVLLLYPAVLLAAPSSIKIVMDNNYPPYVFLSSEGKLQGLLIDQWKLWEQKTGIRAEISAMDWGEALQRMKAGEFDVIDTIFKTEARSSWLDFSQAYARLEVSAFFDKQITGISDAASLKGFVIGAKSGDDAIDVLKRHGVDSLILFTSYEAIVQAAKEHKITVFVVDTPPALYYLHKLHIVDHYKQSPPLNVGEFHRAVKKGNTELLKLVEDGFGQISPNELRTIEDTWLGSPLVDRNILRYFYIAAGSLSLLILALLAWNRLLKKGIERGIADLKTSEERFRSLVESAPEAIFVQSQGCFVYLNPAMLSLLGASKAEELLGTDFMERISPECRDAIRSRILVQRETGNPSPLMDQEYLRLDGSRVPVETTAVPIRYQGSDAHLVFVRNISDRKQSAEALRQSEEKYRQMTENIKDVVWQLTPDLTCSYMSPAAKSLFGYRPEELVGKKIYDFFTPASREQMLKTAIERRQSAAEGQKLDSILYEIEHLHMAGGTVWAEVASTPIYDQSGTLTGFQGITRDISERRKTENSLRESEERFKKMFDSATDGILIADVETKRFVMGNSMICSMLHYSEKEIASLSVTDIHPEKDLPYVIEQFDKQMRKEIQLAKDIPLKRKDGSMFYADVNSSPLTFGGKIYLMGIFRDTTEQRKIEEQLRQSQKMESVGTLAGGVAHDFNNILTAISGYGHLALMKMADSDPNRMNLHHILESSERAAHLTRDLLLFSRKQPIDRKLVDLNEGIQKLGRFLSRVIGEDITFKTTLSGGAIQVFADTYQIDQVLMNLATNARDAMPDGGSFTITTEQIWLDEEFTSSHGLGLPGKFALICVSDTGQGMDEETRQRIFEPFFTTKEVGKGTGLGLSVVYGIVQQHDGAVTVSSVPGQGTTFRIYLPINETTALSAPLPVAEESFVGGTETILLAEDDRTVREMTRLLLEDFGYTVITAVDGEDAVKKFSESNNRIQLLLFDLIMPRKSGKDAYDEILKIQPAVKVIFASGYDPNMVRQKALLEQNVPVVYKPVPMGVLLKKIREVIDRGN